MGEEEAMTLMITGRKEEEEKKKRGKGEEIASQEPRKRFTNSEAKE